MRTLPQSSGAQINIEANEHKKKIINKFKKKKQQNRNILNKSRAGLREHCWRHPLILESVHGRRRRCRVCFRLSIAAAVVVVGWLTENMLATGRVVGTAFEHKVF